MPFTRPTAIVRTDTAPKQQPSLSPTRTTATAKEQLSECCVSGHIHEGRPTGLSTRVAGLDAYEAIPPSGEKAKTLLFITDVFGWTLPNARLLADELALTGGFYVIVPDLFDGDAVSHDMVDVIAPRAPDSLSFMQNVANAASTSATLGPWLIKHRESIVRPRIDGVVQALRDDPDVRKIGAIGFCWGARYALLLAGDGSVDAVVANHPSLLAIPAEVEAVTRPVQINIGDKDVMIDENGIKTMQDVLNGKSNVPSEVNVFPGAVHGFTVRGDMTSDGERTQKEKAARNAITWLNSYL